MKQISIIKSRKLDKFAHDGTQLDSVFNYDIICLKHWSGISCPDKQIFDGSVIPPSIGTKYFNLRFVFDLVQSFLIYSRRIC